MIEVIGTNPISSVRKAGMSSFVSVLRNKVSKSFSSDPGRYHRPYVSTRGILIRKDYVEGVASIDLNKGYRFQFNPSTIQDVKETLYEVKHYAGLAYNDYVWSGGGERNITFQLFLDNTPQSKQRHFRPESYGSSLATEFETNNVGYSYNSETGEYTTNRLNRGKQLLGEVTSIGKTLKESVIPSKGPSRFGYVDNGAYSISRVDERGILPEVERIQSFLYPATKEDEATPLFYEGGVVSSNQFRPPSVAILALGPLYLEGIVRSAPVKYTLFDSDLTPIRATIDLTFSVFEFEDIEKRDLT